MESQINAAQKQGQAPGVAKSVVKMTGVEALQALRDGKNVRRSIWLPLIYAKQFDGDIVAVSLYVSFEKKGVIPIGIRELLQDDWEFWNEKESAD